MSRRHVKPVYYYVNSPAPMPYPGQAPLIQPQSAAPQQQAQIPMQQQYVPYQQQFVPYYQPQFQPMTVEPEPIVKKTRQSSAKPNGVTCYRSLIAKAASLGVSITMTDNPNKWMGSKDLQAAITAKELRLKELEASIPDKLPPSAAQSQDDKK